ncbi:helix-turn-helix domain-containing protein [Methylobacterium longum]|uniref:Transcriptional regulator n=1 Tax=Methylobacterium longum TaxID=767694 RepID=A0ABT8AHF2_9HYPH|nr:transcriptional regulator [Methylobacterium longum]MDN3569241.1 transcriptional regulator [Methylobacterium longum]GJE14242.1 hypothetical protein FOHLNKBM_5315 [Methylobacterium longum]
MTTGLQILQARRSLGWERTDLAKRAKVPLSVVARAESSPGEPAITIAQLNALMQALRGAGTSFPPADSL